MRLEFIQKWRTEDHKRNLQQSMEENEGYQKVQERGRGR